MYLSLGTCEVTSFILSDSFYDLSSFSFPSYMYVNVYEDVHIHVGTHTCEGSRSTLGVIPQEAPILVIETYSLTGALGFS